MENSPNTPWGDVVERLRSAADDLRAATGPAAIHGEEQEAATARLKSNVSRLEQSASDLRSKLASGLDAQRAELKTTFDKERAEKSAGQLRDALDELAGLARTVTVELKTAAESSFAAAQPEIKSATRALEDVAASAASWMRTILDPERTQGNERTARASESDTDR